MGDVIATANARPMDSVPALTLALSTLHAGDTVTLGLERAGQTLSIPVGVIELPHEADELTELGDPDKNAVPQLGIVGVDLNETTKALVPDLRSTMGVLVTARRQGAVVDSPLIAGDVIRSVNAVTVRSLDGLRVLLDGHKSNSQIVLQIERGGRLTFITITIY